MTEFDAAKEPDLFVAGVKDVMADITSELFDSLKDGPAVGERHPVVRTGERAPIPPMTRRLIWHRDRGRCQMCGRGDVPVELDHVTPWSAGGADTSTNLRLLCGQCNTDRSNYRTLELTELLPVTPICDPCMVEDGDWIYQRYTHPDAPCLTAFCGTCKRRSTVSDPGRLL